MSATPFQSFVRGISFPLLARREGLPGILQHLKELHNSQFYTKDQLLELQFTRLNHLLHHANKHVPYYRAIFQEAGFEPENFKSFDDLSRLPFLTKSIIRNEGDRLLAGNIPASEMHRSETGGTTGIKMGFYRNNACLAPKEAALYRFEQWSGWNIGERMGLVWPAQQDYVGHWTFKARLKNELFQRQVVFPAAVLSEEAIADYVALLRNKRPAMIRAFVSPLYETARYLINHNFSDISPKGVITTGEPLYDHQRQLISRAFNCPVFDSYRCREVGPIAQECQEHNGMHINAESLYVEVVPPEEPEKYDAGIGEIVVTDLLNYGMPFIRYSLGDMGAYLEGTCPCGRGLPRIQNLAGRTADQFVSPGGKRVSSGSLVLYLVDEAPGVLGQVQLIQDRPDHLIIRYTPDPPLSKETMQYQQNTVFRLFGEDMRVSFEQVPEIPREKSGKYVFSKCLLTEEDKNGE